MGEVSEMLVMEGSGVEILLGGMLMLMFNLTRMVTARSGIG